MEYGLVVLWLGTYLALGVAALPLAASLFPRFPDRGAALAIPVGLATVAVVGHLVGHLAFGWVALLAGIGVLLAASTAAGDSDAVEAYAYVEAAVVFTAAFLLVVAVRAVTPEIAPLPVAIGEKFLDFGLLQTTLQAETLPPEDMWFAGRRVRYHYGGQMLTALLTTFTGTAPRFAYNLALAGFYASLVTAAYGLAGAVAVDHGVPKRAAAILGAFFVGIAGNLYTAGQVVAWLLPDSLVAVVPGIEPGGETLTWTPQEFWYFDASRVLPVRPADPDSFRAATEFPLFAWLNGDLHAHMMSQPFMLLVVGLLFAFWHSNDRRHRQRLLAGAVPPVVGLVGITNVWSLPSALGVVALVVLFAPGEPASILPSWLAPGDRLNPRDNPTAEELRRIGFALGASLLVLAEAIVWTAPFWTAVLLGGPQQEFGYWSSWTPLGPLLIVHGGFLAVVGVYFTRSLAVEQFRSPALFAAWAGLVAVAAAAGVPAVGLVVPLVLAGWWLLRKRPAVGFPVVLVVAGAGLVLLVELVTIEGERFNVIFKPYAHIWLFWAIATAVLLPRVAIGWPAAELDVDRESLRRTGTVLAVAVVVMTGLYAGFAVPAHFANEPSGAEGPTLDGTAYTYQQYPDEAAAIAWLDERPGAPTIVTAAPGGYWWKPEDGNGASAPASLTGSPTVLGWTHEEQYRGEKLYERRLANVTTIYEGSTAEQAELIDRYGVEYVYVGPAERTAYNLTVADNPNLEVAFSEGDVVVYEVSG